jgi:hypothetical protein
MHIYKFRLLSVENDEFVRDIEIRANQTFKEFHDIISQNVKMNGNELASFHICDQSWTKHKEITLLDMRMEIEPEGTNDETLAPVEDIYLMENSRISDFIEEPHQRMVYEYDFLDMTTLFIELTGVWKLKDENVIYPQCTYSEGDLATQPVPRVIAEEDSEMTEELLADFDELLDDTFEYKGDNPGEFY